MVTVIKQGVGCRIKVTGTKPVIIRDHGIVLITKRVQPLRTV